MYFNTLAFILGCWISVRIAHLELVLLTLVLILSGIAVFLHRISKIPGRMLPLMLSVLSGLILTLTHIYWLYPVKFPTHLEKRSLILVGVIDRFPRYSDRGVSFTLNIEKLQFQNGPGEKNVDTHTLKGRVKLGWFKHKSNVHVNTTGRVPAAEVQPGDRWRLVVQLKKANGFRNPGSFDYEKWLFKQKIIASGYVKMSPLNRKLAVNSGSALLAMRSSFDKQLQKVIALNPLSQTQAGLIRALALGERSLISLQQWKVLRDTGTAHLVAISGLHIGLAAGFAYAVFGFFWRRLSGLSSRLASHKAAAIAGSVAAVFYAGMAGFAIPAQRALVMTLVVMLTLLRSKNLKPGKSMCIALFAVLALDPLAILEPGLWLSFVAVAFIFFAAPLIRHHRKILSWVGIQWLLLLCLAPLSITFFQTVSIIGPIANMLVLPVVSLLVVPLILLACIALLISHTLASWLLAGAGFLLQQCWWLLQFLAQWVPSITIFSNDSLIAALIALAGITLMLMPWCFSLKLSSGILLLPLLSSSMFLTKQKLQYGEILLTVLDSGQGLAVVIKTANHVLLYDTGAKYSDSFDIGSAVVVPFLRHQSVRHINWVIISHKDNDHRGGFDSVAKSMSIGLLLSGSPESLKKYDVRNCNYGQSWSRDGVRFDILHPNKNRKEKGNNRSCVLRVHSRYGSLLLTGDIHRDVEQKLYNNAQLKSDILLVPHHGSKTSSSWAFIREVAPKLAIVSAGYQSRFNHPAKSIMQRYKTLRIPVFNTAQSGAVEVKIGATDESMHVKQFRKLNHRYWHRH